MSATSAQRPSSRSDDHEVRRTADAPVGVFAGLTTLDVIHRSERAPGRNEKATASRQDVAAGGPAANAAVVFAALGGRVRLVTALGTGAVAQIARQDLESHGVEILDVTPDASIELGVSAIRVDPVTGDRSVLSMDAGAHHLSAAVVPGASADRAVRGADVVLLDGHHPVIARALADAARRAGVPVVVDAGRWRPVMADLVPAARTVVASADFRWHETDGSGRSLAAPWPALAEGQQRVVTHGGAPVEWWTRNRSGEVPVPQVDAVDTLGAGDAFHGAFAYFSVARRPAAASDRDSGDLLERQLSAAAEVASFRCTVAGPRDWLAGLEGLGGVAGLACLPADRISRPSR